ncbi:MAG: NUDIX domain-containing protein [Bacteroidetes bacterium]|nr:NUDIX domain-containing protein [Bacteroidota bacterium]MBU1113598.1 NUDIX domain-containing protein [Bacteroidota bacterium]MBU1796974.1 NUDIX domain-containing protein [Bacteroidota bacterium]
MVKSSSNILKNVSTDCVIFGFDNADIKVLLVKLAVDPGKGEWALPGSNILYDEDLDVAAKRVLCEFTGLENVYMEQLQSFGKTSRFPLFRVITIAFFALLKIEDYSLEPGPKVTETQWHSINKLPKLPFDHNEIIETARKRLKQRVRIRPIGFELLPQKFTLTQIQNLYESILNIKLDTRNFRKKLLNLKILIDTHERQKGVAHRAAKLYKFDKRKYNKLKEQGINFEL